MRSFLSHSKTHTNPNSAFHSTTSENSWIELYHSRPSWKVCQISFRKPAAPWVPFGSYQLLDASHVRPGFRAFRIRATCLEFRLANQHASVVDSNHGLNYRIESPGRYVVESSHGCRRVSDSQLADCLRAIRPKDKFVELLFESQQIWRRCFVNFAMGGESDNTTWFKIPMKRREGFTLWFLRIDAPLGITCAFSDGAGLWDSNKDCNYHIRMPGKYNVGGGGLTYCGPADLDMHLS